MHLFDPLVIRGVTIPNRVVVSPMSQYIAEEGVANDWHLVHLGRFALGGAGLVFTEATAVEARGRRTHGDLGLWSDTQIEPLARVARFVAEQGAVPGVQLAHAGRKASERRPWHGETPVDDEDVALRGEAPWEAIAPSALPYGEVWPAPTPMHTEDIAAVLAAFRDAARRAEAAGLEVIEVYAAHGFLAHQFYSPLANERRDGYGGDFEGRIRFALELADALREVWPERLALFFRLSLTDWVDEGWTLDESVELARRLGERGVDLIDCSSGGIGGPHRPRMPLGPGFMVPRAARVRREAGIATMAVGFIWDAAQADEIIRSGQADAVALARELLAEPNWPLRVARELGLDDDFGRWKPQFGWWLGKRERVVTKLGMRQAPAQPAKR